MFVVEIRRIWTQQSVHGRAEGGSLLGNRNEMNTSTIKKMLNIPILGIVPEDKAIEHSRVIKSAVIYTHPKSKSAQAYQKITRRLLGPDYYKKQV